MMSKNELKANHNGRVTVITFGYVGKYDVKERIESKSQPSGISSAQDSVGKYDVKERIESKSQRHMPSPFQRLGWQI